MTITEANDTSVLICALMGDPNIPDHRVVEAAFALKARIQKALMASPRVSENEIYESLERIRA